MAKKHNRILLIDVAGRELRWGLLARHGGRWSLDRTQTAPLPAEGDKGVSRRLALRGALTEARQSVGAPAPAVYVALPKGMVFLRVIETPRAPRKDMIKALELRATRELPRFDPADVAWDFEIWQGEENQPQQRAILSAVRRDTLAEFLENFQAAGLTPDVVDVEPLALARWIKARGGEKLRGYSALIDVGENNTSLTLMRGGLLRHFGQAPVSASMLSHSEGQYAEQFADDIALAFQAFNGDGPPPDELILCGVDAPIDALKSAMTKRAAGARVHSVREIVADDRSPSIDWAAFEDGGRRLASLAERAIAGNAALTNLAPRSDRAAPLKRIAQAAIGIKSLAAIAAILLVAHLILGSSISNRRNEILAEGLRSIEPLQPRLELVESTADVLGAFEKEQFSWLAILDEINTIKPDHLMLNSLRMEKSGRGSMQGEMQGDKPIQEVEAFITRMNESPWFDNVRSGGVRPKAKDKKAPFTLRFELSDGAKGAR